MFKMMKRITYLFILLALPLLSFGNDALKVIFVKANNQYAKAQYKQALETYKSILTDGNQSAVVYFNMGNAYYKMGDLPSALLYYEKAHKLNPGDEDINANIQLANSKTTDKIDATPDWFLTKWWDAMVLSIPANTLGWLSILFFLAGSGVLIVYLFASTVSSKRLAFYSATALVVLALITIILGATQVHYFSSHRQAIVFSNSVTVKSEPGTTAKTLFVIHEGTKVDVLESNESNWVRVRLLNGNDGWIHGSDVKSI